jgi:2-polyprenyl-3-methyl-5-hydroxy-6-metoxy-1,4-benzoquinol methylase
VAFEELMGLSNRLLTDAQALAALTARLRLAELGVEGDPDVRVQLDRVVDALGAREHLEGLDDGERSVVLSFARSYLAQALELVEDPARVGSWSHADPVLLQAQGSASAVVARLIGDAGLGSADARILDVGTGVGGLAVAFATRFPESTIVGIDPWEPALALARERVASAGLDGRVMLLNQTVQELEDADGFDLVWLPSFFIPERVLDAAIARIHTLMRPNAMLVFGTYDVTGDEPLASAVHDLFTVRAGGSVVYPEDALDRLRRAGFDDAREIERDWDAPLRFVVGRRG